MGSKTHLFCNRVRIGRSRSSNVDDCGTLESAHATSVRHSNLGHYVIILHRFWDTATYCLRIACFSYLSLIRRPRYLCFLWNFAVKLTTRKLESWDYLWWKLQTSTFLTVDWSSRVTDRRNRWRNGRTGDSTMCAKRNCCALKSKKRQFIFFLNAYFLLNST